jgi:hypothetical protein
MSVPTSNYREKILQIEAALFQGVERGAIEDDSRNLQLRHQFIPGGYAREMTIPTGFLLVGKIHKHPCFNFVSKGRISVLTEEGVRHIQAPASFVSGAGVKRVGFAHEETVWTTVHITDEVDVETIEDALTVPSFEVFEALKLEAKT